MLSPAVLEQPGRWRATGIVFGLALAFAPAVSLLWPAVLSGSLESAGALGSSFGNAVARSLLVAAGAAGLSFLVGLPTGVLAGLYEFPARRVAARSAGPTFTRPLLSLGDWPVDAADPPWTLSEQLSLGCDRMHPGVFVFGSATRRGTQASPRRARCQRARSTL